MTNFIHARVLRIDVIFLITGRLVEDLARHLLYDEKYL